MREIDALTEAERRLEAALKSLRPAPAQLDVAAALAAARSRTRRRVRIWRTAAAAALLAAGSAWLAFGPPRPAADDAQLAAAGELAPSAAAPPTLLAYRLALGRSTAELDALLDDHVAGERGPDSSYPVIGVLAL